MMNLTKKFLICAVLLAGSVAAYAMPITGTVTNKTAGKPSEGDRVSLVDPSAGMSDIDKTTTDKNGHFTLNTQGPGQFLIRVDHQGSHYFSQAPQSPSQVNISVYDVAEKVDGISIEANVFEMEADNGQLTVDQLYYVKNTSNPPTALLNKNTFEFALPDGAVLEGVSASRPTGLPTTTEPEKLNQKGHYTINSIPIEPTTGDKFTVYDVHYHLPYKGKYAFTSKQITPADNLIVLLPKSITFTPDGDAAYQPVPQNPRGQMFAIKGAKAGQNLGFSIAGTGTLPRGDQAAGKSGSGMGGDTGGEAGGPARATAPGGGIGTPNSEDDALSKYKWWIVGILILILVAAAALLLRRPQGVNKIEEEAEEEQEAIQAQSISEPSKDWSTPGTMAPSSVVPSYSDRQERVTPPFQSSIAQPVAQHVTTAASLLNTLKDELFAVETDKLNGLLDDTEYAEAKFAIDVLLKRALKKG